MNKNVDAIYEDGAFRPVNDADIPLPNGTRVRLSVETVPDPGADVLELAASVYAGLSDAEIADVEEIATDRCDFFSS